MGLFRLWKVKNIGVWNYRGCNRLKPIYRPLFVLLPLMSPNLWDVETSMFGLMLSWALSILDSCWAGPYLSTEPYSRPILSFNYACFFF